MKRFFILCLIFVITPSVFAANVQKVFLNEAIEVAVNNNVDIVASGIEVEMSKNKVKQANRLQNPALDSYYFMGNSANSEPKQFGLSQNIEIAKRNARKNLAKSELKLSEKNYNYTVFDLKMDVREAYIDLVAAKSILDTLEQQKQLQEELLTIAKNRVNSNNAPLIDVIQAEIALNQIIAQVNTARMNVKKVLFGFNKVINSQEQIIYDSKDNLFAEENNFQEMLTPPVSMNFPDVEKIVREALKRRYDIQIRKQEIDIAEKNFTVVARQRIPDAQIVGGYAYLPARDSSSGSLEHGAYAGVSLVNLPLFYNFSPEIKNASLKIRQAELNKISTENKAIKDVTAAYEKFLTAAENLKHYESKIVIGSEKLIEISKKSYEKGETDIVSLIVMKQSYKSIIIGYTQALAEYYNSWTNVLREINDEDFSLNDTFL